MRQPMRTCPSCLRLLTGEAPSCPACGASLDAPSTLPTLTQPTATKFVPASDLPARTPFLPGSVLQGRYRIINLLGRGGMGEVYRADDLRLGQTVALKFLRLPLRGDAESLRRERMLTEVRLARRVTHPYVCRVHDLGAVDGLPFVTMEYVDGEDLASLLRRIGRLPEDKAVQVALQLCAGLAAAHDQGVIHRDLKPANVMIDGRGRARITDFGLAALADEVRIGDARVGTPAYMAPEQLEGLAPSVRSDLYALGLVLHELFTGRSPVSRQAAGAGTPAESSPLSRTGLLQGLDPDVERVIMRCLETDPDDRPASAHAVAAALPGGDPLAAALAQGETPSPQMVAARGGVGGLSRVAATAVLGVLVVGLGADLSLSDRGRVLLHAALERPPAVLRDRAEEMLTELGQTDVVRDSEHGLEYDLGALEYVAKLTRVATDADYPAAVYYWYRRSPEPLTVDMVPQAPGFTNPAGFVPGMTSVRLAPDGALLELIAIGHHDQPAPAVPLDWRIPFAKARLEPAEFESADSLSVPPIPVDEHRAWNRSPNPGRVPLHVEAAAFRGRLVYFKLAWPWSRPLGTAGPSVRWWFVYGFLLVFAGGLLLARRNLRLGRADVKGASRLLMVLFFTGLLAYALPIGMRLLRTPVNVFILVAVAFTVSALAAVCYLALEPFVRRHWPDALTAWARVVNGRARDPLVGRGLLLGSMGGVLLAALELGEAVFGSGLPRQDIHVLLGGRYVVANVMAAIVTAGVGPTTVLLLFVLVYVLLRRPWAAAVVTMAIGTALRIGAAPTSAWALELLSVAVLLGIVLRLGLLAGMVAYWVHSLLSHAVVTAHLGAWYADMTIASLVAILCVAVYGFFTSSMGRYRQA